MAAAEQPSEAGERRRGSAQGRPGLGRWGTAGRMRNGSSQHPRNSVRTVMASQGARGPHWPCVHPGTAHSAIFRKSWEIAEFVLQLLWANSQVFKGSR